MLKLCFISFYEIKEYILSLKLAFEKHLYTIENYPLYRFAYDENDKIENYPTHLVKYLQKLQPDLIFWIFLDVEIDVFKLVKSSMPKTTSLIMYLADQTPVNDIFLVKLSYFDYVVTHHLYSLEQIIEHSNNIGINQILYLPSCYDDLLFNPEAKIVDKYKCDLVYLSYHYNNEIEQLVDQLVEFSEKMQLKLRLYGTSQFKGKFTDHYVSNYTYLEHPLINAAARLVICDDPNQIMKILGQKRLFAGVGMKTVDYSKLYIGEYHQINFDKLKNILSNTSSILEEMSPNIEQLTESTYQHMCNLLHQKICLDAFDKEFYVDNFFPELKNADIEEVKQHYLEKGFEQHVVPIKFKVPKGFDDQAYAKSLEAAKTSYVENKYFLYYHWKKYSNNLVFITDDQLDLSQLVSNVQTRPNISFNNMCQIFKVMIDLYEEDSDKEQLLVKLSEITRENPHIDINLCLKMFFQWKEQICSLYLEK